MTGFRTLHNRVVLITGASSGIGAATARQIAAQGGRVLLAARRMDRLQDLVEELGSEKAVAVSCDVRNRAEVHAAFEIAIKNLGGLDVVLNNAGRGMYAPVAAMNPDAWQELWSVNVQGALHVMQEAAQMLSPGGVLVNVASIVGKVAVPHMGGYSATKSAVVALSDAMRIELAQHGIRVVTIYPGSTETEFRSKAIGAEHLVDKRITRVTPDRVARVIIRAILTDQTRVWVTWPDRIIASLGQAFPRASDWVLRKVLLPKKQT